MLARALRTKSDALKIHAIKALDGAMHSTSECIVHEFQSYYAQLYNLRTSPEVAPQDSIRSKLIQKFLAQYSAPPTLSKVADALDSPLTIEAFDEALTQTKPGKSPGPDGFTSQYYRTFHDSLVPHFLKAIN